MDRVFCGHTHKAGSIEREGVSYYNSGSWADFPPTYMTVASEGIRIHEYRESLPEESSSTETYEHDLEYDLEHEAVSN